MFDKLFKYSAAVTRHQNGPHAQSREQFLKKMLDDGLALPTIRRTAWALLAVADTIGVSVESITEEGLDHVLSRPFRRRAPVAAGHSTFTVKLPSEKGGSAASVHLRQTRPDHFLSQLNLTSLGSTCALSVAYLPRRSPTE